MARTDPGPGRLGLNSAAQTHFSKQSVAFLVACREERFHPNLLGRAVCSRVPYECVGLSAMGRKLLLQNSRGRNFQQKMHCRGWESWCCSSILPEFSSGCLLIQFSFCTWSKRSELETGASVFLSTEKASKWLLSALELSGKVNFCFTYSSPGASHGDGALLWVSFVSRNVVW